MRGESERKRQERMVLPKNIDEMLVLMSDLTAEESQLRQRLGDIAMHRAGLMAGIRGWIAGKQAKDKESTHD